MATVTETPCWTIEVSADTVTFAHSRGIDGPRVWSGHGLAMPESDLPGFGEALGEVMKLPRYWSARARSTDRSAGEKAVWSEPRFDPDDDFVYLAGPCHHAESHPGYHPVRSFTLDLVHVRGLRVRIAAYLHA